MKIPCFVVDAFADLPFKGNPAAVCLLQEWIPDTLLQSVAAEINLSETAYLVPEQGGWHLRWFTPTVEVDLCGHATLASAFVLARMNPQHNEFRFNTLSGMLKVNKMDALYTLDFPERPLRPIPHVPALSTAMGVEVLALTQAGPCWIAELEDEAAVLAARPDFARLAELACSAVNITAKGTTCDFVSRFFAPKKGIPEDPVTGSAHCGLVPYWAARTGGTQLHARQLSPRGGEIFCEYRTPRVLLSGRAVLFSEGSIMLT